MAHVHPWGTRQLLKPWTRSESDWMQSRITTCIDATMIWIQYFFLHHINTNNQALQRYEITKTHNMLLKW